MTNGATGDIQMATQLARAMIMEWGMSDKLGRVRYNGNEQEVFLGHSVTQTKHISDETAKLIDEEIRALIQAGEEKARSILREKIDALHAVAKALLDFETISGEEVQAVMRGEKIERRDDDNSKSSAISAVPPSGRARPREGAWLGRHGASAAVRGRSRRSERGRRCDICGPFSCSPFDATRWCKAACIRGVFSGLRQRDGLISRSLSCIERSMCAHSACFPWGPRSKR